ncbi:uncharacterized protein N7487_001438 [Penicillium crustosum]|uniref:uncharacterized protein n=1 Tax=Penicillium crustosum TaxID=36656 RepID=UPI0023883163|nr:uncharacterized protein N7487_001438 [Penicillium crustosum]KAJ5417888.1 hypothetical protein N7487_001438 [Penicillium crustosum]
MVADSIIQGSVPPMLLNSLVFFWDLKFQFPEDPSLHGLVELAHRTQRTQKTNVKFQCSEIPLRVLMPKDQIIPALII